MNKLAENMKIFWEKTAPRNAHLGESGEQDLMRARYHTLITDKIKVKGKTVIDFGHGGGLLGELLLSECEIKKYIGYDIAKRSHDATAKRLAGFLNKELILLKEHRWDFAEKKPDIIVALAVMIHFPTKTYLDNFLKTVNESGAKFAVLEIRDKGHGTMFQKNAYSGGIGLNTRTSLTCDTNETYVSSKLTNYDCFLKTDPKEAPTQCQVLHYRIKRKSAE